MPDPIIRGPKIPLAWSTGKSEGYVVEKTDEDAKADSQLIEDEDGAYVTEIHGIRRKEDISIDVMPLSTIAGSLPEPGDIFEWVIGSVTKKMSISSIKKNRTKTQAMKWTLTGVFLPLIHT